MLVSVQLRSVRIVKIRILGISTAGVLQTKVFLCPLTFSGTWTLQTMGKNCVEDVVVVHMRQARNGLATSTERVVYILPRVAEPFSFP